MRPALLLPAFLAALAAAATATANPPAEDFLVWSQTAAATGPRITPYLQYQAELAWREDDARRRRFAGIRRESDLVRLQLELRQQLLTMLGGLPSGKTALRPQITGRIPMDGFHIEKLVFESLPGIYVTALVYVPEDHGKHPAVLVPCGHAANGKAHYQALCQRLVRRGYVVICWDPVGQGERSQFWDAKKGKSRYNLICAEHAVMGNMAYLAGTNLARWEVWDGVRALDYLLTRPEVDPRRISITGTSGGGFQAAHIAALDQRIKVAAPSCYITALPMRVYNRIFQDPDSDPEQDLYGMISNGVDHPGLLLLMYPRPVMVAAAALDFFPIEGTHKTFREVADLYRRFGHADRMALTEGYHDHQYSAENQEAAIDFLDHFNGLTSRQGLPVVSELDDRTLQCTRTGQVMLDYPDARPLLNEIRDYYFAHRNGPAPRLGKLYYGDHYPGIRRWTVGPYQGAPSAEGEIAWEAVGSARVGEVSIDRYLLRHSRGLVMPLLHIYRSAARSRRVLLWFSSGGKATAKDWPAISKHLDAGYEIVSFDFRGLGETRMPYQATSPDDPTLAKLGFDAAYVSPLSGVLADYVYNSLLTGRPSFLQMMEDAEIASRFCRGKLHASRIVVTGEADASRLARAVAQTLPGISLLLPSAAQTLNWSEIVEQEHEIWPIQYLLPGGAAIH